MNEKINIQKIISLMISIVMLVVSFATQPASLLRATITP